jgi:hypothetical protein
VLYSPTYSIDLLSIYIIYNILHRIHPAPFSQRHDEREDSGRCRRPSAATHARRGQRGRLERAALLAERDVLRHARVDALPARDVEVVQVCARASAHAQRACRRGKAVRTVRGAVEHVLRAVHVLEVGRREGQLVVGVRRGRVADEDARELRRELLRDLRVRGEERRG